MSDTYLFLNIYSGHQPLNPICYYKPEFHIVFLECDVILIMTYGKLTRILLFNKTNKVEFLFINIEQKHNDVPLRK